MLCDMKKSIVFLLLVIVCVLDIPFASGARRGHRKHRSQRSHETSEQNHVDWDVEVLKHHVRRQAGSRQTAKVNGPQLLRLTSQDVPEPRAGTPLPRGATVGSDARSAAPINTRPTFTDCKPASIPEGELSGTYVTRVEATDPDSGPAGELRYEIVRSASSDRQFTINPKNGEISTAKVFDRDEPKREKDVWVTVKAVDEGTPALDILCTLLVTITDKNDNAPIFDKNDYKESIPQDSKVKQTVMRVAATDIDEGKNAEITYSLLANGDVTDLEYFKIDPQTGFIILEKLIEPGKVNYGFELVAEARDGGTPSNKTTARVNINVASSNKRAPEFIEVPPAAIDIEESLNDFNKPVATLTAKSNIDGSPDLYFSLVNGQTEDTNKDLTFRLVEKPNGAVDVVLSRKLDYETVASYTLTVRVQNTFDVSAEIVLRLRVLDSNDEIPSFTDVESGSVLENSAVQTFVLKVKAIDKDGTSPNNKVTYRLIDNTDTFSIDPESGEIRTQQRLDRETKSSYAVTVLAEDGAASSLTNDGKPNGSSKKFKVEVLDQNDNPPRFQQAKYSAEIAEDADLKSKVIEVTAKDLDDNAVIRYDITEGNVDGAFLIEPQSGIIKVNQHLDYEKIKEYNLRVRAHDGIDHDYTTVQVIITNVNDNPPEFENMKNPYVVNNVLEEQARTDPIAKITVRDPDWDLGGKNPHITFSLDQTGQYAKHFRVTKEGDLYLEKGLDRDPPNGYPQVRVTVIAEDRLSLEPNAKVQSNTLVVEINLDDINDNAPYLTVPQPVVFNENQKPMMITNLTAEDNDDERAGNGTPFSMKIDPAAEAPIKKSFTVSKAPSGVWQLQSNVIFDREQQKSYTVPIIISDSGQPPQTGTSMLEVIIGDENDNDMKDGKSSIFVYNYKNSLPDTQIGRAYVDDPDDWDLPDKEFTWFDTIQPTHFDLSNKGMITMRAGTPAGEYKLRVKAYDQKWKSTATAEVTVTSLEIPEEAVRKSGSIRLSGTNEVAFITSTGRDGQSKKDLLRSSISKYLQVPPENVDIFTVRASNKSIVDVRFSAHNSPYWDPVRINGQLGESRAELQVNMGLTVLDVGVDECMKEPGPCDGPCSSFLTIKDLPHVIHGNTSSFVGVNAYADFVCACQIGPVISSPRANRDQCDGYCYNGGTCKMMGLTPKCQCSEIYEGQRCEALEASFSEGVSFGWFPALPACTAGSITFEFTSHTENGMLFYNGPASVPYDKSITDFVAIELDEGHPVAYLNLGSGTRKLQLNDDKNYADKETHQLEFKWNDRQEVRLILDSCYSTGCQSSAVDTMPSGSKLLNVNGPIQLGKVISNLDHISNEMKWTARPQNDYFTGCLRNLRFNNYTYDMASMGHSLNVTLSCRDIQVAPVVVLGQTMEILIIVLSILFILLLLALIFALWRRRRTAATYKEFPEDVRENVVNYSDEGGGEEDKYGYDLSVLRMSPDGKPLIGRQYKDDPPQKKGDVGSFLQDSKGRVDHDTEGLGIDDVRHYAYEGDGNSNGSLSSLNSGTDDGDLDFGNLSEFGPRFRKLADMYGLDSDDSSADEETAALTGQRSGESWC